MSLAQAAGVAEADDAPAGIVSRHVGSLVEWMQRNAEGSNRLVIGRCPLLPSPLDLTQPPMSPAFHPHAHTAARGEPCVGAVWLDSGITPGLVVVDSNRPASPAVTARGLLKQFGAAH